MITVEAAMALVLALAKPLPAEPVALRRAAGRVLAVDAVALRDQPPFAASAMDGYAVAGGLVPGSRFRVIGEAGAGHAYTGLVGPGEAVRIFTGAPLPVGATRVLIQEDVKRNGEEIELGSRLEPGDNIRPAGADFVAGSALKAPRRLSAHDLALLAAMNLPQVMVARRPVLALLATGDELVMPGETPRADQIIASNCFALAAMAEAEGCEVRLLPIARDSTASLRAGLDRATGADLIVTIGGASVGDHDLVAKVAEELGMEQAFYKIAMRPGKPLMAGRLRGVPMLGLPGNPVSAIVCGHLFLLPLVRALQGLTDVAPRLERAILSQAVEANGPRAHYMRARIEPADGLPQLRAFSRQDSALLSILSEANALLYRPIGDPARPAGAEVHYMVV